MINYCPNALENKIIITIHDLNKDNFYPNQEGVYKILKGIVNEETIKFKNYPTFSVLISANQKKISLRISLLIRHGFIKNKYYKEMDMMLLELTDKGHRYIFELSRKKINFKKKTSQFHPNIFEIK